MKLSYAIVFVSDMDRSIVFYRDIFGLPLKYSTPEWSEFLSGEATLALHYAGSTTQDTIVHEQSTQGTSQPGFRVESLNLFHAKMIENRVECLQPPTESFGVRIAKYADPDGLVISVSETREDDRS